MKRFGLFLLFIVLGGLLFINVTEAEEKEVDVYTLEEIVVTATKTQKKLGDSPAATEVVTKNEIKKKGYKTADEALQTVAGVYADRGQGLPSTNPIVTLRGTGFQSRTLVLVDGQPINEYYYRGGGVNFNSVSVVSIERIEVVKGPFSTLYGGSAMGGVVSIITKAPEKLEVTASVKRGNLGSEAYHASIGNLYGNFGFYLNAEYKSSDGYDASSVTKTATEGIGSIPVTGAEKTTDNRGNTKYKIGSYGKQWFEGESFQGKFFYNFTPVSKLAISVTRAVEDKDYDGPISYLRDEDGNTVNNGVAQITDNGTTYYFRVSETNFLGTYSRKEMTLANINYDHSFGSRLSLHTRVGITDQWWEWATATSLPAGKSTYTPSKNIQMEQNMNISIGEKHELVAGIAQRWEELSCEVNFLSAWKNRDSKTSLLNKGEGKTSTTGLYVQDEYKVRDDITFYIGLRADKWRTYNGSYYDSTFSEGTQLSNYSSREKFCFSPKLSLVYKPWEGTTIKPSWGMSFRGPGPDELFRNFGTSTLYLSNHALEPEKINSFELGLEQELGDRTTLGGALWYSEIENMVYRVNYNDAEISDYNLSRGTSYTTIYKNKNIGKGSSKGFEIEVKHYIAEGLDCFGNYTYTDTEVLEHLPNPAIVGKEFMDTPRHHFNAGMSYEWGGFQTNITGRYMSKRYTRDDNADTVDDVHGSRDPYFVADAGVSYLFGRGLRAAVNVTNIFDKQYYNSSITAGRVIMTQLSYSF